MEQTDSENKAPVVQDGNQGNRVRRSSIELKTVDGTLSQETSESNPNKNTRPEIIYKGESEPGSWMFCLRCSLIFLNTFISILGAAITGIGIWVVVDSSYWDIQLNLHMKTFSTGIYVGIAVGVFVMLIGLVGCIGAWKQTVGLLICSAVVIMVIVILEAAAMGLVWATTNNSELQENLTKFIRQGINKRYEEDSVRYFVDLLQTKLECCGVENEEEFGENYQYPESCVDDGTGFPYKRGCLEAAITYLKSHAGLLGGICAAMFSLQIAAFSLTVCLCCGIRQSKQNIF